MRYPSPGYGTPVVAPAAKSNTILIVIIVVITIGVILGAIAIALGVGLGVGLQKNKLGIRRTTPTTTTSTSASGTSNSSARYTCSCSNITTTSLLARIINGNPAAPNSWPWMVYLRIGEGGLCGGFLASYQYVITAAHCVPDVTADEIKAYAGFESVPLISSAQMRTVSVITSHPNYDPVAFNNDIAILKLSSPFNATPDVGPCCLPQGTVSLPNIGERALIMGWGTTIDGDQDSISNTLLQAIVDIQDTSTLCTSSPIKLCAGRGTTDTCQGDSGGPLLTGVNNTWTCTGIVSSGQGCPGVGAYTRVSAFRSFIDTVMKT